MRPGQAAPECKSKKNTCNFSFNASMRPGQAAPECRMAADIIQVIGRASMRPGQAAPECDAWLAKDTWFTALQ